MSKALKTYLADPFLKHLYQEIRDAGSMKSISIDLTHECNLRCNGCYYFSEGMDVTQSPTNEAGFDAFIDAINKIMALYNYTLPELIDYEVRIPKGGHTYALTECLITWECAEDVRKTRGVHANQVFASVLATLKIINIHLQEQMNKD